MDVISPPPEYIFTRGGFRGVEGELGPGKDNLGGENFKYII